MEPAAPPAIMLKCVNAVARKRGEGEVALCSNAIALARSGLALVAGGTICYIAAALMSGPVPASIPHAAVVAELVDALA